MSGLSTAVSMVSHCHITYWDDLTNYQSHQLLIANGIAFCLWPYFFS